MLHVTSLRITNGKLYKRKLHNKFFSTIEELKAFETETRDKFIKKKYPEGIPEQEPDSHREFLTVDSTLVTIPDREFLFYLVKELKFKTIPPKLIELVKNLQP